MSELSLVVAITLAILALAAVAARSRTRLVAGAELRRLGDAIARAAASFLWAETRLVVVLALLVAGVLALAHGWLVWRDPTRSTLGLMAWAVLSTLGGAACSLCVAHLSTALSMRAAIQVAAESRGDLRAACRSALTVSTAGGLLLHGLGLLGVTALTGAWYLVHGGPALPPPQVAELLSGLTMVLPAFGLGAASGAMVLQRGGATYHASSDVGGDFAGEGRAGLNPADARNPALVADLVGDQVGSGTSRALDALLAGVVVDVTSVLTGVVVLRANLDALGAVSSVATFPLLVRALGLLAGAFGLVSGRMDRDESPMAAIWRTQATTLIVLLGGIAGACIWLLPRPWWLAYGGASVLGLAAAALAGHAAHYVARRRSAPLKGVLESARSGEPFGLAHGVALALGWPLLPFGATALLLGAAWTLGDSTHLVGGAMLGIGTAIAGAAAATATMAAASLFGPVTDTAFGMSQVESLRHDAEADREALRLDDVGFLSASVARGFFAVTGGAATVLAALLLPSLTPARHDSFSAVWSAGVLAGVLLGPLVVLVHGGRLLARASSVAREVAREVERQVRGFHRAEGGVQAPAGYTPRYKALVDLVAQLSTDRLLPALLGWIALPAMLGIGLRLLYTSLPPTTDALAALVLSAAVAALSAALVADGVRIILGAAKRTTRARGTASELRALATGDALGDLLANAAAPAMQLLSRTTALAVLVTLPLLP